MDPRAEKKRPAYLLDEELIELAKKVGEGIKRREAEDERFRYREAQ